MIVAPAVASALALLHETTGLLCDFVSGLVAGDFVLGFLGADHLDFLADLVTVSTRESDVVSLGTNKG